MDSGKTFADIVKLGRIFPRQVSIPIVAPIGGDTVVKAGTPINENGEIVNDETVLGILRYDVDTSISQIGVLVIEGVIDFEFAQKHSGIEYSDKVASALPGITMPGGWSGHPGPSYADGNQTSY